MKINLIKASASRICAWSMCVAVALLTAVSFTSCSDDDNGGGSSSGNQGGLVSSDLPSQGWTGSEQNGIVTYKPYYDEPSYFAFNFKDGVCDNAVYNIVFESEAEARYICDMLRDGTWMFEGDEDVDGMEDPEYSYSSKSRTLSAYPTSILSRNVVETVRKFSKTTRGADNFLLKYDVSRDGKVLYVKIDNLKGKTAEQIKYATNIWTNGFGFEVPTSFLFGTWDEAAGKYKCTNVYGIGATYEVDVDFSNGYVSKFVTTLTLPSESWAIAFELSMEESFDDYMEMFGKVPTISRNGKKVSVEAIVIDQVSHDDIMKYLYILDYMNNVPLLFNMM